MSFDDVSIIFIILLALWWFYYRCIRRYRYIAWTRSPRIRKAAKQFEALYANVNAFPISKRERERIGVLDDQYTYGEVTFVSFAAILQIVKPQVDDVFYDLGSGSGKTLFIVALLYKVKKICGIEYLPALHELCVEQRDKFYQLVNKHQNIIPIHDDYFNVDFSDATVIFINATCFDKEGWGRLAKRLSELQIGTRVIVNSKSLDSEKFRLVDARQREMSWGLCSTRIYIKEHQ